MTALERIKQIGERWFLTEPLLFAVYCSHEFCENDSLDVAVRTGNRMVEYAPHILDKVSDADLLEYLKVEMFRILLKHPYQRQPPFAVKALLTQASNITIADVYDVAPVVKKHMSGTELELPQGLCFEEYYNLLLQQTSSNSSNDNKSDSDNKSDNVDDEGSGGGDSGQQGGEGGNASDGSSDGDSNGSGTDSNAGDNDGNGGGSQGDSGSGMSRGNDGNSHGGTGSGGGSQGNGGGSQGEQEQRDSQTSELWDDDEEACCDINGFIEKAEASNTWGTIPGTLKGLIKASLKVDLDYRKMLSLFKTSVLSSTPWGAATNFRQTC